MNFENIILKPLSWRILQHIALVEPHTSAKIAEDLDLKQRQVDAAITKTLIRHGFVIREAKLTRLMKKEYNLIKITDRGLKYVQWKSEQLNKNSKI